MKKRSTLAALVLAAALVLSLTACSSGPKESKQPEESNTPAPEVTLTRGTWTDNVYTNESLGLTFTMPESWTKMDDATILSMMGSSATEISIEDDEVYDMMALDANNGDNVIIMMVKTQDGGILSLDNYITVLSAQMGTEGTVGDTFEQELGGVTYKVMPVSSDGLDQYHMLCMTDGRIVDVLITVSSGTELDSVLANFS